MSWHTLQSRVRKPMYSQANWMPCRCSVRLWKSGEHGELTNVETKRRWDINTDKWNPKLSCLRTASAIHWHRAKTVLGPRWHSEGTRGYDEQLELARRSTRASTECGLKKSPRDHAEASEKPLSLGNRPYADVQSHMTWIDAPVSAVCV